MKKKRQPAPFKAQRRRANLEVQHTITNHHSYTTHTHITNHIQTSSLRKVLMPLCEDYGLRVKALGKHEIIDMIVRYEEQEHRLNLEAIRKKDREDAMIQVQNELKKYRRARNKKQGASAEKRQNLEYKIKVATTTGVLDLSNSKDKNSFRFDYECIPDDAVERFRKKEEEKDDSEIFTGESKSSSQNNLTALWMTNNALTRLHPRLGLLSHSLVRLGLEGNRLRELPSSLFELRNLQYLHLSRNKLTRIPNHLQHLTRLRELDLRDNNLTELCETMCRLVNLRRLNVSKNRVDRVSNRIGRLVRLVDLNLDDNLLIELPSELSRIRGSLKFLGPSNNKLRLSLDDYDENNEASRVLRALRPFLIQLRIQGNKRVESDVLELHNWANAEWIELSDVARELKHSISLRSQHSSRKGVKRF